MNVVIAGAGQAGFQTALSLRSEGYDGSIALIGDEPHLPYQRPPLSKGFLTGKQPIESAALRPESFYAAQRVEIIANDPAVCIDRGSNRVLLASGSRLDYDKLVLATGARVRRLPRDGAFYLRTRDQASELKQRLDASASVAVIGGGFIGLEVASSARVLGKTVTVFELQDRLMPRCVSPLISEFFRGAHTARGVAIELNAADADPAADLVVAGIGVLANSDLALDAGLPVANGILVNEYLRTEDERIFAIGDCASHPNPFAGSRIRLESVQNAVDQAKCVAAAIVGRAEPYHAVPWFWTDQFDIKLQMAGLSGGADREAIRGERENGKFSVFYFRGEKLIAVDSINRPGDHIVARKLLAAGAELSPEEAGDESFDLKSLNPTS